MVTAAGGAPDRPELDAVEIHDILSNERRQMVLQFLQEADGRLTAGRLAEMIAEIETDQSPPPKNIRQSAYVSLHQTHLPKLDDLGVVVYDQDQKTVELTDRAQEVRVYMETVPRFGLSWSEYYIVVAVLGLLLIAASEIGVPGLAAIGSVTFAVALLVLIVGSAAYQTLSQRSTLIHRLRE